MSDNQTDNYYAPLYPPEARPNSVLPNAPKADCPIGIIFGKVAETMRKVSHGLEADQIDTRELDVTRQLSEMFESVEQITEAYKKFEYSQYLLDRALGKHNANQSSVAVNNSGKIYGSFEELKKSTEAE